MSWCLEIMAEFSRDKPQSQTTGAVLPWKHANPSCSKTCSLQSIYSGDSFIRTRLLPVDISRLTSFPDYWIAYVSGRLWTSNSCWQRIACWRAPSRPYWRCRLGPISGQSVNYVSLLNIHSFHLFHMLFLNQVSANRRFCLQVKILSGLMSQILHISENLSPKFLSGSRTRISSLSEQINVVENGSCTFCLD